MCCVLLSVSCVRLLILLYLIVAVSDGVCVVCCVRSIVVCCYVWLCKLRLFVVLLCCRVLLFVVSRCVVAVCVCACG